MSNSMKTIEMREAGGPNVLETGLGPMPELQAGQVLIKVIAAGINGPDLAQRRGHYPAPKGASDLLGLEVSGKIVAMADGVTNWAPGDIVCALTNGGGYAQYVAVNAAHCMPVPDGVSPTGLCEIYFTVWSNLFFEQTIPPANILLVHGGAGGIGSTAVQLGCYLGLDVYATCGTDNDCDYVRSLGPNVQSTLREKILSTSCAPQGGPTSFWASSEVITSHETSKPPAPTRRSSNWRLMPDPKLKSTSCRSCRNA